MRSALKVIGFIASATALFTLQQWYAGRASRDIPPGAGSREAVQQQILDEVAAQLVPLRGTFTGLDGERFSWDVETRTQTDEGIAVSREPRTGRLVSNVSIVRPPRSESETATQVDASDISADDPVIVFISKDQLNAELPDIWQIVIAK